MSDLFKTTGPRHEELIKEALLPYMGRMMSRVGKVIAKHPLKSVGAGLTTMESGRSLQRMKKSMSDAAMGGTNLARRTTAVNM